MKAKNDDGKPLVIDHLHREFVLSPLFLGWIWDPQHFRETKRKRLSKLDTSSNFLFKVVGEVNQAMSTPKWHSMMLSIKPNASGFKTYSTTRFWQHSSPPLRSCVKNFGVAYDVLLQQVATNSTKTKPIHFIFSNGMFLGSIMLFLDVAGVLDPINNINQRIRSVWPGIYHYYQEKQKENIQQMLKELDSFKDIVQEYVDDEKLDIEGKIAEMEYEFGDFVCKEFGAGLQSLLVGEFDGVKLTGGNWYHIYNSVADEDEKWNDIVNEDEVELFDKEIDDPDYVPSPNQLRNIQREQQETFRMVLRSSQYKEEL